MDVAKHLRHRRNPVDSDTTLDVYAQQELIKCREVSHVEPSTYSGLDARSPDVSSTPCVPLLPVLSNHVRPFRSGATFCIQGDSSSSTPVQESTVRYGWDASHDGSFTERGARFDIGGEEVESGTAKCDVSGLFFKRGINQTVVLDCMTSERQHVNPDVPHTARASAPGMVTDVRVETQSPGTYRYAHPMIKCPTVYAFPTAKNLPRAVHSLSDGCLAT